MGRLSKATALYSSGVLNMIPTNAVFLNGKRTELGGNTFNLFDLLQQLQDELALTDKLASLALPKAADRIVAEAAINVGLPKQLDPHLAQVLYVSVSPMAWECLRVT